MKKIKKKKKPQNVNEHAVNFMDLNSLLTDKKIIRIYFYYKNFKLKKRFILIPHGKQ